MSPWPVLFYLGISQPTSCVGRCVERFVSTDFVFVWLSWTSWVTGQLFLVNGEGYCFVLIHLLKKKGYLVVAVVEVNKVDTPWFPLGRTTLKMDGLIWLDGS